jgi:hypothetical protein
MRGPAAQARAIREGRAPATGGDFALHVTELALLMQNAGTDGHAITPRSSFAPISLSDL